MKAVLMIVKPALLILGVMGAAGLLTGCAANPTSPTTIDTRWEEVPSAQLPCAVWNEEHTKLHPCPTN